MGADGLDHERAEAIRAGQARARATGKQIGRPRKVLCRDLITELRGQGLSWRKIARRTGAGVGTVRRRQRARLQLDSGVPKICSRQSASLCRSSTGVSHAERRAITDRVGGTRETSLKQGRNWLC